VQVSRQVPLLLRHRHWPLLVQLLVVESRDLLPQHRLLLHHLHTQLPLPLAGFLMVLHLPLQL
jgi:hypothetical protein